VKYEKGAEKVLEFFAGGQLGFACCGFDFGFCYN
jgi:hypothetical protein